MDMYNMSTTVVQLLFGLFIVLHVTPAVSFQIQSLSTIQSHHRSSTGATTTTSITIGQSAKSSYPRQLFVRAVIDNQEIENEVYHDDDDDDDDATNAMNRRQAVTMAGSYFVAAAIASGARPALAISIDKQIKEWEESCKDTVNTVGAPEKHIPSVSMMTKKNTGTLIEVSVPHVMDPDKPHWIQSIWLKDESTGKVVVAKVFEPTDASPPTLSYELVSSSGSTLTPMLYCNLHGLWKGETITLT